MILVDSSVWIDYFKGGEKSYYLDVLIKRNLILTNELILSELVPALSMQKKNHTINLLYCIKSLPVDIFWSALIDLQILNLKNGINKVGIPDLILVQHCLENNLEFWSLDKHFDLMSSVTKLKLFNAPFYN